MLDFLKQFFDQENDSEAQVPEGVQSRIIKLMHSEYGFNPVSLANMGTMLKGCGIEPSDYGFEKLKPFLCACNESITVENDPDTGLPFATINRASVLGARLEPDDNRSSVAQPDARRVDPDVQAAVATAIAADHGYETPVLFAQVALTLKKHGIAYSEYGYSKLKGFLEACDNVLVIRTDGPGGHPTASVKRTGGKQVSQTGQTGRARKVHSAAASNAPADLMFGEIIHIGVNAGGSDYGIIESDSGVKYLFYDIGVDGDDAYVMDFEKGETVAFVLFTNSRNDRTYASKVRRCSYDERVNRGKAIVDSPVKTQERRHVPDSVQKELYGPLVQRFGFTEEPYPLADFGVFLNEIFFDYTQYGFEKAKPFALSLDKILVVSYAEFGELVHPYFKLKHCPEWDSQLTTKPTGTRAANEENAIASAQSAVAVAQVLRETTRSDGAKSYDTDKPVPNRLALAAFATFADWEKALEELSDLALPEKWSMAKSGKLEVLDSYLVYTFLRLKKEGKVLVSDDELSAVFNTGLVDNLYDDIFACFSKNKVDDVSWNFEGFCTQSSFEGPATHLDRFTPFPEPAAYFDNPSDLLFNPRIKIRPNYDHIIVENIERLPVAFLRNELSQFKEAESYLRQLDDLQLDESNDARGALEEVYESLTAFVQREPRCKRRLMERVRSAVESAEKRARWNYKTAVPVYYPRYDSISLLLPLDLTDDGTPDVALVIERNEDSRSYRGRTIYTLDMAYKNARLVCRLDNDWLVSTREG